MYNMHEKLLWKLNSSQKAETCSRGSVKGFSDPWLYCLVGCVIVCQYFQVWLPPLLSTWCTALLIIHSLSHRSTMCSFV